MYLQRSNAGDYYVEPGNLVLEPCQRKSAARTGTQKRGRKRTLYEVNKTVGHISLSMKKLLV